MEQNADDAQNINMIMFEAAQVTLKRFQNFGNIQGSRFLAQIGAVRNCFMFGKRFSYQE